MIHEKNINQLKSEVQYIQEVGTPSFCGNDLGPFSKSHILGAPFFCRIRFKYQVPSLIPSYLK